MKKRAVRRTRAARAMEESSREELGLKGGALVVALVGWWSSTGSGA